MSRLVMPMEFAGGSEAMESAEQPERERAPRPLRVALIAGSYNYIKDGVALTLNRLVQHLEANGVEVLVFAPVSNTASFPHAGTLIPVPSIPLPRRPEYRVALGLPRAARRRLDAFKPDIVHIAVPDFLGYGALRYSRQRGLPVVASYHARMEKYLKYYGLGWLDGLLLRYMRFFHNACDEVYAPSASMVELLHVQGIGRTVRLWSRGVDTIRFHPAKRSQAWRTAHGIGPGEVVVLFVSRLVREKELGTLTAILMELAGQGVPHRSVIVGEGPERESLQRSLPHTIFKGFLDGEELAAAYASSDIFLFPSDTETFGNVTLEAMASGLPTVCADATGNRSLVEPGVTGFLAQPRAVDEFVAHVGVLCTDEHERRQMGAAARQRSLGFTWEGEMARILGYYRALCRH